MVKWQTAKRAAYRFLIENKLFTFPVDVKKTINKNEWKLSNVMEITPNDMAVEEFVEVAMDGGDGAVWHYKNDYHIIYDYTTPRRLNFTLAHEVGHIRLGHLKDDCALCHSHTKTSIEIEADCFAGRFLAPFTVMRQHNINTVPGVMQYFELSRPAARVKIAELHRLNKLIKQGWCPWFEEAVEYDYMYRKYWSDNKCRSKKNATGIMQL